MKRLIAVLLVICVFLTGCSDMREISDELYAIMLGIDATYDGVHLTVAVPDYGSKEEYQTEILSVDAEDVYSGLEKLGMSRSRKISLLHLKAVVISEDTARSGIKDFASAIHRHPETANAMGVMVSGGDAEELIGTLCENTSGDISSDIEVMLLSEKYNPYCPVVLFEDFYNSIESSYRSPFSVYVSDDGNFEGIAVFDEDKMTGVLGKKDASFIMIASGKMNGGYMDFETSKGRTGVKISCRDRKVTVGDSVKIGVELMGKMDFTPHLGEMKHEIKNQIKSGIKSAILKAGASGCDILGLRGYSAGNFATVQQWQKSNSEFDNISVSVKLELSQSVNG